MYLDAGAYPSRSMVVFVRSESVPPADLVTPVRALLRAAEPGAPVTDVATGEELMVASSRAERYLTGLVVLLGSVALALALVGVYGVVAYFVEQHRRDIGIRLALGGAPSRIARSVIRAAMRLVLAGAVLGSTVGLGLSQLLDGRLFGVEPSDPGALAVVLGGLCIAALAACAAPAWRAARLDPSSTLKER